MSESIIDFIVTSKPDDSRQYMDRLTTLQDVDRRLVESAVTIKAFAGDS